jgi:hypothetical protein
MAGTPTGLRPHPVASPAPIAAAACFLDPAKSRLGHSNPISKCILVFLPILSLNFGIHVGILSAETRPFTHKRAPSKANLRTMTRTCEDYLSHYIPPLKIPTYIYILIYLCVYLLMYVPRLEHGFFRFPTHICIYIYPAKINKDPASLTRASQFLLTPSIAGPREGSATEILTACMCREPASHRQQFSGKSVVPKCVKVYLELLLLYIYIHPSA